MQRYFVKNANINLPYVVIDFEDAHHIIHVMRMKIGSQVYVCDEDEHCNVCEIIEIQKQAVKLLIKESVTRKVELELDVTIAQGLIRREKMEEVIRKIAELGANTYIPVKMERSIVKVDVETEDKKRIRLGKIAKEACEQSHRNKVMAIKNIHSLKEIMQQKKHYDLCLFAYEETSRSSTYDIKQAISLFQGRKLLVLIGPEGGFSETEAKRLKEQGFGAVGLGPRILRTETAPQYVMAAISYQFELGDSHESK
jgi:16S rRNA (uracil1498-N3)-methyltransferase